VAITLPSGLTNESFGGSGWTFHGNTQTFTQSTILAPGSSYPTLIANVYVGNSAPSSVVTTATVSGGGSASSTVTNPTIIN
jgi:hypothetical protein